MTETLKLVLLLCVIISATKAQFFNTRCSHNGECDFSNQFLKCFKGYCQCDRTQIFDHGLKKCVIRPGGKCYFEGSPNSANGFPKCSKNSICLSSICQCKPGYKIPTSGEVLCKPNLENSCKHSGNCDAAKGLECFAGLCQCRNRTLTYQGMFGCVDARNPEFSKMMDTLKDTEKLLKENNLDINKIINEFEGESSNQVDNRLKPRQLFSDTNPFGTIDSNVDLITAPQNLLSAFGSLGNLFRPFQQQGNNALRSNYGPPGAGGGGNQGGYPGSGQTGQGQPGGGGLGGSGGGNQGGYPGSGQTGTGGYPGSGQTGGNSAPANPFALITNLLSSFNRIIPFLRRLGTLLNPFRFIQNLLKNLRFLFPAVSTGASPGGYGVPGSGSPGSGSGSGAGNPSSYGPPGQGSGGSGTGGNNNNNNGNPSTAYGPPSAQSSQNYNQVASPQNNPLQSQTQQLQETFSSNFESPAQFQSNPNFLQNTNKRQAQNQSDYNNLLNNGPPIIELPSQNQNQFVANKFPRQERLSNTNSNFGNSSPYLPEHL